ncbi:uncharacterized protein ZBAI_05051 [Zygosaccharomyces bailii ISA1307]|nr:uncharacterized protein ZBAI_05051 [Zygosaccharomyces bailii ISA1307]
MSSFGAEDFDAKTYSELRPTYPEKFYKILANYHLGPRGLLVDLGCGPGTATLQMADRLSFKRVIGTDLSAIMVQKATFCKELTPESYENVTFMQSPGESFEFLGIDANKQKCDMITAVECVHYFNIEEFEKAIAANLRKDGTIAIWGYGDFFFESFEFLGIDANKQKCDMITAVECVHYFNIEEFEKAIAANLRKDGTIAIWGYGDFFFPDYPYLDAELKHLMSGPDRLGPYLQ